MPISDAEPHIQAQAGHTIPSPSCVLTFSHPSQESERFELRSSDGASDTAVNPPDPNRRSRATPAINAAPLNVSCPSTRRMSFPEPSGGVASQLDRTAVRTCRSATGMLQPHVWAHGLVVMDEPAGRGKRRKGAGTAVCFQCTERTELHTGVCHLLRALLNLNKVVKAIAPN